MSNQPKNKCTVYVLAKDGTPLMPTHNGAKVRVLLKEGRAKVVHREPFTIRLQYETTKYTQPLTMGVDPGYKTIGISVSTEKEEVYASETEIRTDIKEKLATRREFRRTRRSRKVRHRQARFNNRRSSKPKGWLPPSVRQKIQSHTNEIEFVCSILPVKKIVIEVAAFDIQKIKNPEISGVDYQNGPMKGFNGHVREYVLYRDGHQCQNCFGKSGCKVLQVHHGIPRPEGTDTPDNMFTLCEVCHTKHHKKEIELKIRKPKKLFKTETMMNIMRYKSVDAVKEIFGGEVEITYGADTKSRRIQNSLKKTHAIDALMISGHTKAKPLDCVYKRKKHRAHNRQIFRAKFGKHHNRRRVQTDYELFGFRLFDKVLYEGKEVVITSRRQSGYFKVESPDGSFKKDGVSYKKLTLKERAKQTTTFRFQRKLDEIVL